MGLKSQLNRPDTSTRLGRANTATAQQTVESKTDQKPNNKNKSGRTATGREPKSHNTVLEKISTHKQEDHDCEIWIGVLYVYFRSRQGSRASTFKKIA